MLNNLNTHGQVQIVPYLTTVEAGSIGYPTTMQMLLCKNVCILHDDCVCKCLPSPNPIFPTSTFVQCSFDQHVITLLTPALDKQFFHILVFVSCVSDPISTMGLALLLFCSMLVFLISFVLWIC